MNIEETYKIILSLLIIIFLLVIIIRGVFFVYLIVLCRFFYLNRDNILHMHESGGEEKESNRNRIQSLEKRIKESELELEEFERKAKKLEKKINYLEMECDIIEKNRCRYNEITNVSEKMSYNKCSNDDSVVNQMQKDSLTAKQLPTSRNALKGIKKVGLKKSNNYYSIDKSFEAMLDGKLVVKDVYYDKIYVEPEDWKIVEKTYQLYGLDICFKVSQEIRAGLQYRIISVKRQCEMQITDANYFRVLNQGMLEISEITN